MKLRAWVVGQIFRKEMLETLRDRRTLLLMVVVPVLLYPLLLIGMTTLATRQVEKLHAEELAVAIGPGVPAALTERLSAARLQLRTGLLEKEIRGPLTRREIVAAIFAQQGCEEAMKRDQTCALDLYFDETNDRSLAVLQRIAEAANAWEQAELARRAEARALPATFHTPMRFEKKSVSTSAERAGNLAGRILPVLLISLILAGAYYPAVDMSAGEKERGTMQTLLCAPVTPLEIVGGKYLAVSVLALASGAINLLALGFATAISVVQLAPLGGVGLTNAPILIAVSPILYLAILALVTPVALLFSALALAVSAFAKSYREAQSYVAPIYMLAVLPAMVVSLPGVELQGGLVFVPILNLALLLRDMLVGRGLWAVLPVIGVNMVLAVLALAFAARVYSTQEAMLGSGKSALSAVLRFRR